MGCDLQSVGRREISTHDFTFTYRLYPTKNRGLPSNIMGQRHGSNRTN